MTSTASSHGSGIGRTSNLQLAGAINPWRCCCHAVILGTLFIHMPLYTKQYVSANDGDTLKLRK